MFEIMTRTTYLITHLDVVHKVYNNGLENVQNHDFQNVCNNTFRCRL